VVVAAVAVLTDGLREEPTWGGVGLTALLYTGIWFSWISVVLYANVAGPRTRTNTVIVAMFLVAMMAATAPIHFADRANWFAAGFLALRFYIGRGAMSTGRLLTSWPALQLGGATAPWIVSFWADEPLKYVLWGVGLAFDLVLTLLRGGAVDQDHLARLEERYEEERRRHARPGREPSGPEKLSVVDVDREHLQERLGLFVIIVLGEVVSQLVLTASTSEWTSEFIGPVIPAFVILVGIWWLTFSYGYAGAPSVQMALLEQRYGLPLHLLGTAGVIAMAAGFGELAAHPDEHLPASLRWIMCGGFALYLLVMAVSGAAGGAPPRWFLGWALPCSLAPLVVAFSGDERSNGGLLWLLAASIGWMALYGRFSGRRRASGSPAG
jgi:low temperature requirement protein LtrA